MFIETKEAILYSLIPMGAALLGSLLAYLARARPLILAFFFHLAAGIILATAALEFLPYLTEAHEKRNVALSFLAGGVTIIFLHMLFFQLEKFSAFSMALALCIFFIIDGLMIAVGFYASSKTGIILVFSLVLLILLLNFVMMSTIRQRAWKLSMQVLTIFIVALMLPLGSWLGSYLLTIQPFSRLEVLSFTTALFLYLGLRELLHGARTPKESWFHGFALFIGFVLPLILID